MQQHIGTGATARRSRRLRAPLVAFVAAAALVSGACAPPSGPAGPGGINFALGFTIPLPPITIRPPATNIPFGICNIGYQPPGVQIVGATVTIPGIVVDPNQPIITVPNVVVKIPQLRVPLSTVTLQCLGLINLPVQVDLIIPATVNVQAATLNIAARTITLQNPSLTANGAGFGIAGLGDLVIPIPIDLPIPLPTTAISF